MKKNYIILSLIYISIIGIVNSCQGYDFTKEQYKKEVYLLSDRDNIFDTQVCNLDEDESTIYIMVGLSGTTNSNKDYNVTVVPDDSLFNRYNKSNFDIEKGRFAKMLNKKYYSVGESTSLEDSEMDNMNESEVENKTTANDTIRTVIKAKQRFVKIPIRLRNLYELNPDSTYFLEYKLLKDEVKNYNKKKTHVLIKILKKNIIGGTDHIPDFINYKAYIKNVETTKTIARPTDNVKVFPLSRKSVRVLAGNENFGEYKKAHKQILEKSIIITIKEAREENPDIYNISIEPYVPNTIQKSYDATNSENPFPVINAIPLEVETLSPDGIYDNSYRIYVDRRPGSVPTYYKEFRLHYKYKLAGNNTIWKEVQTILRKEYHPQEDLL